MNTMAKAALFIALLAILPINSQASASDYLYTGNKLAFETEDGIELRVGMPGYYLVRRASIVPTPISMAILNTEMRHDLVDALKKGLEWSKINRKEKLSFVKDLYTTKTLRSSKGELIVFFSGEPKKDSVVFDIHTDDVSEFPEVGRYTEVYTIKEVAKIIDAISDEYFGKHADRIQVKANADAKKDAKEKARQKHIDDTFK